MKKATLMLSVAAISVISMTGCSNSDSSVASATATFKDSLVEGLSYTCSPSGVSGKTDSVGKLTCREGDDAEFQLGAMTFGPVAVRENDVITPYRIFPDNVEAAVNLAQLLQSLDDDGIYDEIITIDENKTNAVTINLDPTADDFDTVADTMLSDYNSSWGLVPEDDAEAHLNDAIDDTVAPIVTLLGDAEVEVIIGTAYEDAGATANDDVHGMMTPEVVSTVNTAVLGSYTVTYTATDAAGNTGTAIRNVEVVNAPDTVDPVVELLGEPTVTIAQNSTYTDAGATATDDVDGTLTPVMSGTVNTAVLGTYTITWTATDEAGNEGTAERTVIVEAIAADTVDPVVELIGDATVTIIVGDDYTDEGATATDNIDGSLTPVESGSVNTDVAGTYTITWTATDTAGNIGTVERTVIVGLAPTSQDGLDASETGDLCIDENSAIGQVANQDPFGNPVTATCLAIEDPTQTSQDDLEASEAGDLCIDEDIAIGEVEKDFDPFGNPLASTCVVLLNNL